MFEAPTAEVDRAAAIVRNGMEHPLSVPLLSTLASAPAGVTRRADRPLMVPPTRGRATSTRFLEARGHVHSLVVRTKTDYLLDRIADVRARLPSGAGSHSVWIDQDVEDVSLEVAAHLQVALQVPRLNANSFAEHNSIIWRWPKSRANYPSLPTRRPTYSP